MHSTWLLVQNKFNSNHPKHTCFCLLHLRKWRLKEQIAILPLVIYNSKKESKDNLWSEQCDQTSFNQWDFLCFSSCKFSSQKRNHIVPVSYLGGGALTLNGLTGPVPVSTAEKIKFNEGPYSVDVLCFEVFCTSHSTVWIRCHSSLWSWVTWKVPLITFSSCSMTVKYPL